MPERSNGRGQTKSSSSNPDKLCLFAVASIGSRRKTLILNLLASRLNCNNLNDGSENYNLCCIGRRAENGEPRSSLRQKRNRSKIKRHSPPASFSANFTNVPALGLEKWSRTAQSKRIQDFIAYFRKNHYRLLIATTGMFSLSQRKSWN